MSLLKKHERKYILRRGSRKLQRRYEIKQEVVDRIVELTVKKEMHLIEYKNETNFTIEPHSKRRVNLGSRMQLKWETRNYKKWGPPVNELKDYPEAR